MHKPYIVRYFFGGKDLFSKKSKFKEKLDLHDKSAIDRRDKGFHIRSGKNQGVAGPRYVFEKEDLDDRGDKNLGLWGKIGIDWGKNIFAILMHQYQVIYK